MISHLSGQTVEAYQLFTAKILTATLECAVALLTCL